MSIGFRALAGAMTLLLTACSGGSGPWQGDSGGADGAPDAARGLEANAGEAMVSLGWMAPAKGAGPFTYDIAIAPVPAAASITQSGTTALVRGLDNGVAYTFSVTPSNISGKGAAISVQSKPNAAITGDDYAPLSVQGDTSPSGILNPAPLRSGGSGVTWMAYNAANFYTNGGGRPVRDFSTRLARSDDGGQTFTLTLELGKPYDDNFNDTRGTVCAGATCSGRWQYSQPWLVNDNGDPDPNRRFKLFAHKYFQYPPATTPDFFQVGAIVMWTASSPDGAWSAEQPVLGWNATPSVLATQNIVNNLDPALAQCLYAGAGSATIYNGALDFAFDCPYDALNPATRKIVLLRSSDHALSFQYIATLLQNTDAAALGATYFTAPRLLPSATNAPLLIATPVTLDSANNATANGCRVMPIADEQTGALFREANNAPTVLFTLPPPTGTQVSGCGWDRGLTETGVLMTGFVTSGAGPFVLLRSNRSP